MSIADMSDPAAHYRNAEAAVRKILRAGALPISLGGDHGIPIPVLRAMEEIGEKITLVQIDAHIDWRDEINGEHHGYSSPIRRASELDWVGDIVQIGIRGIGSARTPEVETARAYGADLITAYEMHDIGMQAVLDRIPDGGPYYLTIDAGRPGPDDHARCDLANAWRADLGADAQADPRAGQQGACRWHGSCRNRARLRRGQNHPYSCRTVDLQLHRRNGQGRILRQAIRLKRAASIVHDPVTGLFAACIS